MTSISLPFVEIFKIDSEIGTRSNGVTGTRELQVEREREGSHCVSIVMHCPFQPFEFDSTTGEDNTGQGNLTDGSANWAPEEMFDINKEKACVGGVVK